MDAWARQVLVIVALLVCLSGLVPPAHADWIFDAEAGVVHESNVGLAKLGRDRKSDTAATTSASAGHVFALTDRYTATVTGDAAGIAWDRLGGLSNVSFGTTAAFRGKFGVGPQAPWLRLFGSGARQEYDLDVRDGWRYRLGAGLGTRWGERWDVSAEYAFEQRVADHGKVVSRRLPGDAFDVESQTWSVRADVLVTETVSVFAGYALREGEVVSTTQRNAEIVLASKALTADPAFGSRFVAYRLDATTHVFSAGLTVVLGRRWSANVGYEYQMADAIHDLEYRNHVVRGGISYRY